MKTSLRIAIEDDLEFSDQYTLKVWQGNHFNYTPLSVAQTDQEKDEEQNTGQISEIDRSNLQDKLDFILGDKLTMMMKQREEATPIWIELIVTEKILRELTINQQTLTQYLYTYQIRMQRRRKITEQALYLSHPIIFSFYERSDYEEVRTEFQAKWNNRSHASARFEIFSTPQEDKTRLFSSLHDSQVIGVICAYGLNENITDVVLETGTPIMIWPVNEPRNTDASLTIEQEDTLIKIWSAEESENADPSLIIQPTDYPNLPLFIYNYNCQTQGGKLALLWDNPEQELELITPF